MAAASAQVAPAPEATPTPATATVIEHPTPMDRAYDGKLHVTLAPYVWLPTLKSNLQFSVPTLPRRPGGILQSNVQVGPSDYAAKINSALMFSFDSRLGEASVFGDYIYTNFSTNANVVSTVRGPLGHVSIPVSLAINARLAQSIWELAAGFSIAHGHDADLNVFGGWRQFPLSLTLSYNAVIGKKGIINPMGTVVNKQVANDVIFGLRGKAFLGDGHWFVPYYIDAGAGAINQTWQAYTGAGYTFNHGQTFLLAYRSLNYYGFPAGSPVQKLTLGGPLLGYTFQL